MTTNIIFLLIGIILGIFAGAWGLPEQISQHIGKIKKNGIVDVDMTAQEREKSNKQTNRVRFLGIGLWKKRKKK
jgi:hypothetical protein